MLATSVTIRGRFYQTSAPKSRRNLTVLQKRGRGSARGQNAFKRDFSARSLALLIDNNGFAAFEAGIAEISGARR